MSTLLEYYNFELELPNFVKTNCTSNFKGRKRCFVYFRRIRHWLSIDKRINRINWVRIKKNANNAHQDKNVYVINDYY